MNVSFENVELEKLIIALFNILWHFYVFLRLIKNERYLYEYERFKSSLYGNSRI